VFWYNEGERPLLWYVVLSGAGVRPYAVRKKAIRSTQLIFISYADRYYAWSVHPSRSSRSQCACTWNVHKACVFGRVPSVFHPSGDILMIRQWLLMIRVRFMRVNAWFVCDFFPRHPENLVNFSTHKHAQTQSVSDRLCDWPFTQWYFLQYMLRSYTGTRD